MINLKISVDNCVFNTYKELRKFKDYYVSLRLFLKKLVNNMLFKVLSYFKRYIRNFLKLLLSYLYRFKLDFIANKLLYIYRNFRKKNKTNYDPELKIYNNIIMHRLDYHFKYSSRSQQRFKDLKSAIKKIRENNI